MPEIRSADGRYLCADQGRNSFVLYDTSTDPWTVLWDRWAHEGGLQHAYPEGGVAPAPALPGEPPVAPPAAPPSGTGYTEQASSQIVRPRYTREQMAAFLPAQGPFVFPGYGTLGVRVTNERIGKVRPNGMAYWPVINNSEGQGELLVMVSVDDTLTVFSIQKDSGAVNLHSVLPFHNTGEYVYWSFTDPNLLYVPSARQLLSYHVQTHEVRAVFEAPGEIRQLHSSADGRTHSFTLDRQPAVYVGGEVRAFPSDGYDECQIDKSGRYLLIKEGNRANRIVDLVTGRQWTIPREQGSVGHSDMGYGYMVGEDDQTNPGGVFRLWMLTPDGPVNGGTVYHMDWTAMSRYASHCNAKPGDWANQSVVFSSAYEGDLSRANEIVVAKLNGSLTCRAVCSNLTILRGDDYWSKTRAAIDPTGEWVVFGANMGTERIDIFVAHL